MDEVSERKKLETLDLTEDVIEMILEKKRRAHARKTESLIPTAIAIEELPEVEVSVPIDAMRREEVPEPKEPILETRYRWSALKRRLIQYT